MGTRKVVVSRRSFLATSLLAGGVAGGWPNIVPAAVLGRGGRTAPSERIAVGCIGVGDRGSYILRSLLELGEARVVAVSDVKRDRRETAKAAVDTYYGDTGCAAYNEFEKIIERKDIDACIIASCDHWHVLHALDAVRAGKDVYVEKPLGISVEQDRALRKAVRKHKRIFQFGTQQRSEEKFRRACELVLNGRIGTLKAINVWSPASQSGGPLEQVPPPATLDYDRWLGPAPFTPYTKERDSNKWWWFISDYAIGFIAGWGIHPMDIAIWGGGDLVNRPVEIEGTGLFPKEGLCNTATSWDITCAYEYGPAIHSPVIHYRSEPAPEEWKSRYGSVTSHGTAFEGTEGWVHVNRELIRTYPESLAGSVIQPNEVHLHRSDHHLRDFLDSVKARKDPASEIDSSVRADILCQICDIAIRVRRKVRWDPKKERFTDDRDANRLLERPMRRPWRL